MIRDDAWGQRRPAKTLVKLLAVERTHSLHRDQILEILWPHVGLESAINGFSKALHAARRALEPDLLPRAASRYLRLSDDILSLNPDETWIDIDHFESLSEPAMQLGDVSSCEAACAAYTGELLPEDRYEDWAEESRTALGETHNRLLVMLADALVNEHSYEAAAKYLRKVVHDDPAREDVHRRLMRLYVAMGNRHDALHQYQVCREALERELDTEPEPETDSLYQAIVAIQSHQREPGSNSWTFAAGEQRPPDGCADDQVLDQVCDPPRHTPLRSFPAGSGEGTAQRPGNLPDRRLSPGRRVSDRIQAGGSRAQEAVARRYGELLDRLEAEGRMVEAADVSGKLATVLTALGRYSRAEHVLRHAMAMCEDVGDLERVRLLEAQVALLEIKQTDTVVDPAAPP